VANVGVNVEVEGDIEVEVEGDVEVDVDVEVEGDVEVDVDVEVVVEVGVEVEVGVVDLLFYINKIAVTPSVTPSCDDNGVRGQNSAS